MKNLSGLKFGRLTVETFSHRDECGGYQWLVVCECGTRKTVAASNLRGSTKSCGCLKRELDKAKLVTHGKSGSRTHRAWKSMLARCYTPSATGFQNYGARGVKVCEKWRTSFEAFLQDMGEVPEGFTLDRVDVNGDYEPENCRWATRKQQGRNKRNNRVLIGGGGTTLVEAAEASVMPYDAIRARLNRGWSLSAAVSAPRNTKMFSRKIKAGGVEKTIAEWAATLGMSPRSLRLRLENGWSEHDAVTTPKGAIRRTHEAP